MKGQLKDSGFYKSFSTVLIEQAKSSSLGGTNDADFNNPEVQKAANDALSEEFLEQQGNDFIDGNYKWLSGQTEKPEFKIDLGPAREKFAENTGLTIAKRLASLPTCTNAQLAQLKTQDRDTDFYSLECLPFTTNPDEAGQEITDNLKDNSSFLNNAVLTPDSLDPSQASSSEPYYQQVPNLPKVYQVLVWSPVILGAIALLAAVGMVFIAHTRKRGLRRISIIMFISGLFLIIGKILVSTAFNKLQDKVNTSSSDAPELQKSLLNLADGVQKSLTSFNLYFGIAFVVVAIIIFIAIKRHRGTSFGSDLGSADLLSTQPEKSLVPPTPSSPPSPSTPPAQPPTQQPTLRAPGAPALQQSTPAPKKKRPPRLIQ